MEPYPLLYYQDLEVLLLMLTASLQLKMMDLHLLLVSEVSKSEVSKLADLVEEDQEHLHSAALDQVALVLELYSQMILLLLKMELLPLLMEVLSMFSSQEVLLLLRELQLLEPDMVELPSHPLLVDGAVTTPQKEQLPTAYQDFPASTLSAPISLLSRLVTPFLKQLETDSLSVQTHMLPLILRNLSKKSEEIWLLKNELAKTMFNPDRLNLSLYFKSLTIVALFVFWFNSNFKALI